MVHLVLDKGSSIIDVCLYIIWGLFEHSCVINLSGRINELLVSFSILVSLMTLNLSSLLMLDKFLVFV